MRILCCYRELDETNTLALVRFAPQVEFVSVGNPTLVPSVRVLVNGRPKREFPEPIFGHLKTDAPGSWCWNAIADRWATDDLMIVESDVEITSEVVPSFRDCPESWCIYTYQVPWGTGLGCVRFRKELQEIISLKHHVGQADPDQLTIGPSHDPRHFTRIASSINYSALTHGFTPHQHGDLDNPDER